LALASQNRPGRANSAGAYLDERLMKLRETLDLTEALGKVGELPDVELSENGMKISPLEGDRPDGSEALNGIANGMLPRLKITDLLLEVDRWTNFTRHFSHLKTNEPVKDRALLLTAQLGRRLARAVRHQVAGVIKPGTVSNDIFCTTTCCQPCWQRRASRISSRKLRKATKHCVKARLRIKIIAPLRRISVWGPGLLVMLADTDAGNVVTGAQAGARWGYRLLPLLLVLMPMPYMVQELTVRLGIYTGRGHGELIRERFGVG
jgi:hypothetical protein